MLMIGLTGQIVRNLCKTQAALVVQPAGLVGRNPAAATRRIMKAAKRAAKLQAHSATSSRATVQPAGSGGRKPWSLAGAAADRLRAYIKRNPERPAAAERMMKLPAAGDRLHAQVDCLLRVSFIDFTVVWF